MSQRERDHTQDVELGGATPMPVPKRRDSPRNESDRQRYERRKLAGECTRCGKPAADGKQLCADHVRIKARRDKRSLKRRRKKRAIQKLCRRCGQRKADGICRPCLLRMGRLPSLRSRPDQGPSRQRTADADNRMRYHGQAKRGAPSKETEIKLDVRQMERSLIQVKAGLELVDDPSTDVEECDAMLKALAGVADLVRRTADDLRRKLAAGNYAAAVAKREKRAELRRR